MPAMPVVPEQFHVYDTTLRDGAQQEGIHLSVDDKLRIAGHLDKLGVTFIEGGWPGANPADTEFFARARDELRLTNARLVVSVPPARWAAKLQPTLYVQALDAGTDHICLVAKSHDAHVYEALRTSLDENLAMIHDTVTHLTGWASTSVDCEHFFDGFRANPGYALDVIRTAPTRAQRWPCCAIRTAACYRPGWATWSRPRSRSASTSVCIATTTWLRCGEHVGCR